MAPHPGPARRWALRTTTVAAVLGLVGGLAVVPTATAEPTPSIEQAKRQLLALDRQTADAVEVLNGMKVQLDSLNAHVADRQAAVVEAQQEAGDAGEVVDEMARQAYTGSGGVSGFLQALGARTPEEFLDRIAALSEIGRAANSDLVTARAARDTLETQQGGLDEDQAILSSAVAATAVQRARLEASTVATTELLASLRAEERARIAAEAEAKRLADMAAAATAMAGVPRFPSATASPEYAAHARIAVEYALSQVGGVYSMNAQPPRTWDCSKLTAYAWSRAGVSLTPYSFTQFDQTQRINQEDLQPGDLLFYFGKGAHHVSMYVGNGMAVSASNPGVGVELQTDPFGGWYGERYSGAGRVQLG